MSRIGLGVSGTCLGEDNHHPTVHYKISSKELFAVLTNYIIDHLSVDETTLVMLFILKELGGNKVLVA